MTEVTLLPSEELVSGEDRLVQDLNMMRSISPARGLRTDGMTSEGIEETLAQVSCVHTFYLEPPTV